MSRYHYIKVYRSNKSARLSATTSRARRFALMLARGMLPLGTLKRHFSAGGLIHQRLQYVLSYADAIIRQQHQNPHSSSFLVPAGR